MNALFFWLVMLLVFYMAYALGVRSTAARLAASEKEGPPPVPSDEQRAFEAKLTPMLAITSRKSVGSIFQFEGRLRGKAEEMFRKITEVFHGVPFKPILMEGEGDDVRVVLLPDRLAKGEVKPKWWLHGLLFCPCPGDRTSRFTSTKA